jgi:hypothetical protein
VAVENTGVGMRLALHDFCMKARVYERTRDGLECNEPASGVLGVLCNGFANGLEHPQLVHDIPSGVVRRAHLDG